ncbi:MAG: hypothetical protein RIG84_12235 [Roseovarius sp.]
MEFDPLDPNTGARFAEEIAYAEARLAGEATTLALDLYLPAEARGEAPLLVWFHGGGFNAQAFPAVQHRRLGRQLTAAGFALAAPRYRQKAGEADLGPVLRRALPDLSENCAPNLPEGFSGAPALAAMEDALSALAWLEAHRAALGLAPNPVVAGSEAGGFTAFNAAFAAPSLGLASIPLGGVLSYSGGLSWPGCFVPGRLPVFAMQTPRDPRIPPENLRHLARSDPALELIEAPEQQPGSIKLWPGEAKAECYGRIRAFLKRCSARAAEAA